MRASTSKARTGHLGSAGSSDPVGEVSAPPSSPPLLLSSRIQCSRREEFRTTSPIRGSRVARSAVGSHRRGAHLRPLDLQTAQGAGAGPERRGGSSAVSWRRPRRPGVASHRSLPEFYATVPGGVVPGARTRTGPSGQRTRTIIPPFRREQPGLTDLGAFVRVEINALQPLWTCGSRPPRMAAAAGARSQVPGRRHGERHPHSGPRAVMGSA
jgi:hypothetical protein